MDSEEQSAVRRMSSAHVSTKQLKELLRKQKPLLKDERVHILRCQQCSDRLIRALGSTNRIANEKTRQRKDRGVPPAK